METVISQHWFIHLGIFFHIGASLKTTKPLLDKKIHPLWVRGHSIENLTNKGLNNLFIFLPKQHLRGF
ncbi:hypothetical protein VAE063_40001 [Vibrio aestuarianus]|uniref:Uncharacterized protein n=1 Tax=Vibrio aestuarianus TaxID=28171 RepID=A0ABM9FL05_9VIBR|nr:hypothetical protein VAE063_40001 [Vibrio aestuarianus]